MISGLNVRKLKGLQAKLVTIISPKHSCRMPNVQLVKSITTNANRTISTNGLMKK